MIGKGEHIDVNDLKDLAVEVVVVLAPLRTVEVTDLRIPCSCKSPAIPDQKKGSVTTYIARIYK